MQKSLNRSFHQLKKWGKKLLFFQIKCILTTQNFCSSSKWQNYYTKQQIALILNICNSLMSEWPCLPTFRRQWCLFLVFRSWKCSWKTTLWLFFMIMSRHQGLYGVFKNVTGLECSRITAQHHILASALFWSVFQRLPCLLCIEHHEWLRTCVPGFVWET